jgi:hypothetical protein
VFAPLLAAVGAVAAVVSECSIAVERVATPGPASSEDRSAPPGEPRGGVGD